MRAEVLVLMRFLSGSSLALLSLVGCGASHGADVDSGIDAHRIEHDGATCGGPLCAGGEECCLLDGRCVAAGDPSCAVPPSSIDPGACARASDCGPGEYCGATRDGSLTGFCTGIVGHCLPVPASTDCGGFGDGVCGCDGRTYATPCEASMAGVRVSVLVPCGIDAHSNYTQGCENDRQCAPHGHCDLVEHVCTRDDPFVGCGSDSQCPARRVCCRITGTCYDPARAADCVVPPEGTTFPCQDDTDCWRADGSWWTFGMGSAMGSSFCDGPGCGPGGGCVDSQVGCSGVFAPVCGCDGATYVNECEARRAGVRVAHEGDC
jgi:hypothetical protein